MKKLKKCKNVKEDQKKGKNQCDKNLYLLTGATLTQPKEGGKPGPNTQYIFILI